MTTQIQTPTGLEEEWRFTPLKRLVGLHDGSAISQGSLGLAIDGDIAEYSLLAADDALVIPEDSTNDAVVLHVRAQVEQRSEEHTSEPSHEWISRMPSSA